MKWYSRHFGAVSFEKEQTDFAALHFALGGPAGMMMLLGANRVLDDTVYITLPDAKYLTVFPGFAPSDAPTEQDITGLYHVNNDALPYIRMRGNPLK